MATQNSAEQPKDRQKRRARVTLNFAPSEREMLERLAGRQRIDAAVTARNIILDYLEGKLVPVAEQPLPGQEVAA